MSLLGDIIKDAIDSNTDLPSLLRKCKVLAFRLDNQEFNNWTINELEGYKDKASIPQYRIIRAESYGNFENFAKRYTHLQIPLHIFTEDEQKYLEYSKISQSVSDLDYLLKKSSEKEFQITWPPILTERYQNKIFSGFSCLSAWQAIPSNTIVGILDTVKTRVLSFALELEKINPDLGSTNDSINPSQVLQANQVINNNIYGNIGSLKTIDQSQTIKVDVKIGDIHSVLEGLRGNKVPDGDLEELEKILLEMKKDNKQGWSDSLKSWFGDMIKKIGEGAWQIGLQVAVPLLTNTINQYLGLPQ